MEMPEPEEDFNSDFTTVPTDTPDFVHDGSRYWLKAENGDWISMTETSFRRHLIGLGYGTKAEGGASLSRVDTCLNSVEMNYRVKWAGPLAGHWSGFKRMGGNPVLITTDPVLVEPLRAKDDAPALEVADAFGDSRGWPILGRVFRKMLSCPKEGDAQLWVFFSYVRHTLDCLYGKVWDKSPTFALAGEINCGKSLLVEILRELYAKKVAQPYDWMIGRESFNGDMLEAVLLSIDDEVSDTNPKSRAELGERCKKMTSNTFQRIRAMMKEGLSLQPLWRLVICVNDTPDKLMVLPQIEEDNQDKIILVKAFAHPMPMPSESPEDKRIFWQTIRSELPQFVWWLMNEFEIPKENRGRFGVKAYHHPEILSALSELSNEMDLWYALEKTIFEGPQLGRDNPHTGKPLGPYEWMGKIGHLRSFLTDTSTEQRPTLTHAEAAAIPKPTWLGQRLVKLSKLYPESVIRIKTAKARYWHIKAPKSMIEGADSDSDDSL